MKKNEVKKTKKKTSYKFKSRLMLLKYFYFYFLKYIPTKMWDFENK